VVTDFLDWLAGLPDLWLLLGAGLLVFGETSLGLGFIAPGETGLGVVGTTATTMPRFVGIWLVTSGCAILGYCGGYLIGRHFGPKIRDTRLVRNHGADGWDSAVGRPASY
jgi:membrane protein DedA with SNARE-associated domain